MSWNESTLLFPTNPRCVFLTFFLKRPEIHFFLQCTSLKAAWSTSGSRTLQRLNATNKEVIGSRIPSSWQKWRSRHDFCKRMNDFSFETYPPKVNMSQVSILWLLAQWIFWKGGKQQRTSRKRVGVEVWNLKLEKFLRNLGTIWINNHGGLGAIAKTGTFKCKLEPGEPWVKISLSGFAAPSNFQKLNFFQVI